MTGVWNAVKAALRAMICVAPAAVLIAALASAAFADMDGCPDYTEPCPCPAGCGQEYCERACSSIIGTERYCYDKCGPCQCAAWASTPAPGVLKLLHRLVPSVSAVELATAPASGRRVLSNPDGEFIARSRVEAQRLADESAGIGVQIQESSGSFVISGVEKDGPAEKVGLKAGDEFVRVDGKITKGSSLQAVAEWIRGRPGTMVSLVVRGKDGKIRKVAPVRVARKTFRVSEQAEISGKIVPLSKFKSGSCPKVLDGCHLLDVQDGECVFTCRRME